MFNKYINPKCNDIFILKRREINDIVAFRLHVTPRIIVSKISLRIRRARDVNGIKCIPPLSKSNSFRNW